MPTEQLDWQTARDALTASIQAHPAFTRLVREVAVAEQPTGRPYRLRNSPTYAAWRTRGQSAPSRGALQRRARLYSEAVAADLGIWPNLPKTEGIALVYGTARELVRQRLLNVDRPTREEDR